MISNGMDNPRDGTGVIHGRLVSAYTQMKFALTYTGEPCLPRSESGPKLGEHEEKANALQDGGMYGLLTLQAATSRVPTQPVFRVRPEARWLGLSGRSGELSFS